jgi:D-beta-D-heptose 7-phosphate kinase/D-beta-D-heptose 1-phosphate adenosyltransferase
MKILVIGDSCIDVFRYGKVNRLAPEAPVPVIIPQSETSNPGMAGNVVRNIEALGHKVDFITNENEIKKIRYVCSKYNHLLLRVDEGDKCNLIHPNVLKSIKWDEYDAVVISDYCKGFLSENDIKFISEQHRLTFLDSKKLLGEWAHNISFIKINFHEYERNEEILKNDPILKNKTIITRGKYGCEFQEKNYPTKEVPVKDVSGAGDTFLAGLVHNYTSTKNIESAIEFAQQCTIIVIQKTGVSTI